MHWFITILLFISSFSLPAQEELQDMDQLLEGSWAGVLTHPGGYRSEYVFHLQISKSETGYKCWSFVKVDNIYAEMNMSGTLYGDGLLILEDLNLLNHDIGIGMEWCMKRYHLRLLQEDGVLKLEGDWEGKTTFGTCDPGKVHLTKRPPRA